MITTSNHHGKTKSQMTLSLSSGGLICVTKTHHKTDSDESTVAVKRVLELLEEEGLWNHVEIKKCDRYIKDTSIIDRKDMQDEKYISGTLYLFRKPLV